MGEVGLGKEILVKRRREILAAESEVNNSQVNSYLMLGKRLSGNIANSDDEGRIFLFNDLASVESGPRG